MIDFSTAEKSMIYNGERNPNTLQFYKQDLREGGAFGFSVRAKNFNGFGEESQTATFTACTSPSGLKVPIVLDTTKTTMYFEWEPPSETGACPILSYDL